MSTELKIKPIETVYNGYRFRSRLEARWAVFFDTAGIRYEYEPDGYSYTEGYLPDFYLPDDDMYVDVKSEREDAILELKKAVNNCCITTRRPLVLLSEVPYVNDKTGSWLFNCFFYHPTCRVIWWQPTMIYVSDYKANPNGFGETVYAGFDSELSYLVKNSRSACLNRLAIPFKGIGLQDYAKKYPDYFRVDFSNDHIIDASSSCPGSKAGDRERDCFKKARQARFEHGE